jgi:arylsulfatase A-like enzyme
MPSLKNKPWIIIAILVLLIIGVWALRLETNTGFSPSVLLVSIDSLRPDHLGCYGYLKNTSPNIDKLAKKGVVFTQAIAQGSWTLPSTASIVTSSYPSTHKVYT